MGARAGSVVVLAALALAVSPGSAAGAASDWYGVNATGVVRDMLKEYRNGGATGSTEAAWESLRDLGVSHIRVDVPWPDFAGPTHSQLGYNFAWDDLYNALGWMHIGVTPVLVDSPLWESSVPGESHAPPTDLAAFAQFAGEFAAKYGTPGVSRYEVWNEPNLTASWHPVPDPARYGELFVLTRNAIKAAQLDASVLIGGLAAGGADRFVLAMNAAHPDALALADGVAYHAYGANLEAALAGVASLRKALSLTGHGGLPIFVTEAGWSLASPAGPSGAGLADSTRAADLMLLGNALSASDCNIASFEPFTWYAGSSGGPDEWSLSMLGADARPTAEAAAFHAMIASPELRRAPADQLPICSGRPGVHRSLFPLAMNASVSQGRLSGCIQGAVGYMGAPLNGVRVQVSSRSRRSRASRPASVRTDISGRFGRCGSRFRRSAGKLILQAVVPNAAASPVLRPR